MGYTDEEIEKARLEEERRGRRPLDVEELEKQQAARAKILEIIRSGGTEEEFREAVLSLGISANSSQFENVLALWYASR